MDKIKVNNQVIIMRKYVKQAKIHTINRFTKQVKDLQNKKGTDCQVLKNKRKVERLLEEIAILKKMKPDFVSKLALSKAKDWKSLLEQKNCSLEDRCMALLVNYPAVQKEVEKFCSTHSFLVQKIPDLVLDWEAKRQDKKGKEVGGRQRRRKPERTSGRMESPRAAFYSNNIKVAKRSFAKESVSGSVERKVNDKVDESERCIKSEGDPSSVSETDSVEKEVDDYPKYFDKCEENLRIQSDLSNFQNADTDFESADVFMLNDSKDCKSAVKDDSFPCKQSSSKKKLAGDVNTILKSGLTSKAAVMALDITNYLQPRTAVSESHPVADNQPSIHSKLSERTSSDPKNSEMKMADNKNYKTTKAIAILNLNDFQDSGEISIKNTSPIVEETTGKGVKSNKDPFFLMGGDSEESDKSDSEKGFKFQKDFQKFGQNNGLERKKFSNKVSGRNSVNFKKVCTSPNSDRLSHTSKQTMRDASIIPKKNFNGVQTYRNNDSHSFKRDFKTRGRNYLSDGLKKNNKSQKLNSFLQKEPYLHPEKDDKSPLHPSWEAKRKLKEAVKTKFQGKRVVFD